MVCACELCANICTYYLWLKMTTQYAPIIKYALNSDVRLLTRVYGNPSSTNLISTNVLTIGMQSFSSDDLNKQLQSF